MKKKTQIENETVNKAIVISRLQGLKKWDCSTGDSSPFASQIDWEEDNRGEWICKEDVEALIRELQANRDEIIYQHCLESCKMAAEETSKNFIKPDVVKSVCPHCNHVNLGTFENLNHCFVCEHEWQTVL